MYRQVMEDKDELIRQVKETRQALFEYSTDNAEVFSREISEITDKNVLIQLRKSLELAKDAFNLVRTFGDEQLKKEFQKLQIEKLPQMLSEVNRRIAILHQIEALNQGDDARAAVNASLMDIEFNFSCIGRDELKIIDGGSELRDKYSRVLRELLENFDHDDPEYISLDEAFRKIFQKHGFAPASMAAYTEETKNLNEILERLKQLRRANEAILKYYDGDEKYARVHKRIREENRARAAQQRAPIISKYEEDIAEALKKVKSTIDKQVYNRNDILKNDSYFDQTVMRQVALGMRSFEGLKPTMEDYQFIQKNISNQYRGQYQCFYN